MSQIWKGFLEPIMPANVHIEYGGSPVRKVYEALGEAALRADGGVADNVTYRVYSDKKDTLQNYAEKNRQKYMQPIYADGRVEFPGEMWPERGETSITTSGEDLRIALGANNFEAFAKGMPASLSDQDTQAIFDILIN